MNLKCNNCKHNWQEKVDINQKYVMCPECMTAVPIEAADQGVKSQDNTVMGDINSPSISPTSLSDVPPPTEFAADGEDEDFSLGFMYGDGEPPAEIPESPAEGTFHENQTILDHVSTPPPQVTPEQITHPEAHTAPDLDETIPTPPPQSNDLNETIKTPQPKQAAVATDFVTGAGSSQSGQTATGATVHQSVPSVQGSATPPPDELKKMIGRNIDGFQIEKLLGAGGMGAVFLAHQVSLDRKVALKILPERFARNPELIARFTREALSAAQLNHHNIIQVYDVGSVGNLHYIAMEYVRGQNLGELVRKDGRLQMDDAAAFVLQAARGLKYAHDRGIIHRDIKPDNLMINEHGVVKIADMGLAKWRKDVSDGKKMSERDVATILQDKKGVLKENIDVNLTLDNIAMGTPAYMSPEQASDATSVGPAADQYSLGCTLYYLCAGKAPYSGTTAFELISKHKKEPFTPLDVYIQGVPTAFSGIITRMLKKQPDERYSDLGGVVTDLEAYLGLESEKGPYTPREHHLKVLEDEVKKYYSAPAMKLRKLFKTGFAIVILTLIAISIFLQNFPLAGGFLGMLLLTPLISFIVNGIYTKDYLFRRMRSVFFGMPFKGWLAFIGNVALFLIILIVLNWWLFWLIFAMVALGVAFMFQIGVSRPLQAQRKPALDKVQQMLKELRFRGVSEEAIQDFVCRFSPTSWEEFFEELFGYENMIIWRGKWAAADKVKPRRKYGVWRDPIARWLENIEETRKEARERKQLTKAEVERLKARGVSAKDAAEAAEQEATRILKEGLIKEVPEDAAKKRLRILPLGPVFKIAGWGLRGVCAAVGLYVTIMAGANITAAMIGFHVPDFLVEIKPEAYFEWGYGGNFFGLAAGVMLFLMAFSCRWFMRIVTLIGVILVVAHIPVIEITGQTHQFDVMFLLTGCGLTAVGFGISFLTKSSGGRF